MMKETLYDDGLVKLDSDGLTIRRYYFPIGTSKYIPYTRIKDVQERDMGLLTGKARIWGTGDFKHYSALDMNRFRKEKALILDLGKWFIPVITPDDPDRVLAILQERISRT